ncbi:hypothetical protein EV682_102443 [Iodobacter fluviatilis]|uniref:Uncharacterized protein n=1 Tax=Iodobacter fluviatilis TaxID=537 RepID=A0A377QAK7_9NEIS|nr:hypothetical protein EV682_102443 [Iodobacter fluviatilis]STQ90901.1 Uncharacterised protein [Iodobacter fluviatilis]
MIFRPWGAVWRLILKSWLIFRGYCRSFGISPGREGAERNAPPESIRADKASDGALVVDVRPLKT